MSLFKYLFLIFFVSILMACSYPAEKKHHEFNIVVEVQTPSGVKTGKSGVKIDRTDFENNNWCSWMCPGPKPIMKINASAVVVQISEDKRMYVLLTSKRHSNWIENHYPQTIAAVNSKYITCNKSISSPKYAPEKDLNNDDCYDMPTNMDIPYFVSFDDEANFGTMVEIDPFNLSNALGKNVRLKSLHLVEGDANNSDIVSYLPWIERLIDSERYAYFNNGEETKTPPFPNGIGRQSFLQVAD